MESPSCKEVWCGAERYQEPLVDAHFNAHLRRFYEAELLTALPKIRLITLDGCETTGRLASALLSSLNRDTIK